MGDLDRNVPVYTIGVVMRLTGLTARQIRYYEQEGLVDPIRTEGGHRLYTPLDVERIVFIKAKRAEGLNLEGVRALLRGGGAVADQDAGRAAENR